MKLISNTVILATLLASSSTDAFAANRDGKLLSATNSRSSSAILSSVDEDQEVTVISANPVIKIAAQGMSLLKPVFKAEAEVQAAVLGAIGKVDKDEVEDEIESNKLENSVLIYTYALSPFSTEAISILEKTGCEYKKIELGAEWFALGGKGSQTRVALSNQVDNGATSLPKVFIGGQCIGGCSELASLAESGELTELINEATGPKKTDKKKFSVGGFSF